MIDRIQSPSAGLSRPQLDALMDQSQPNPVLQPESTRLVDHSRQRYALRRYKVLLYRPAPNLTSSQHG